MIANESPEGLNMESPLTELREILNEVDEEERQSGN